MIIPEGMTFNVGRREYKAGDTLPANAPESVRKQCEARAVELAKKAKEAEKSAPITAPDNSGTKPSDGGKQ